MHVSYLFLDLNAFFASVEQQEQPRLRGRPMAVAPVATDHTCCIAVSYEARPFGIRTGTNVGEARRLCPGLVVVEARPSVYVEYHHRIIEAVNSVLPVEAVRSIDEMACRLGEGQREPERAIELAGRVKEALRERIGEHVRCSIGLAPNEFLAKIIGDTQKPDGLVLLRPEDLPRKMFSIPLGDLTGIGPRMLLRLERHGVRTVEQLYQCTEPELERIWNGVVGRRWWYLLRGHELTLPPVRHRSLGHSHVLPPEFRSEAGTRSVLLRLIHKAAARLRKQDYWATGLDLRVSFVGEIPDWRARSRFPPCRDTSTFVELFVQHWPALPRTAVPLKVSATLTELVPAGSASRPLFPEDHRREEIARTMDAVNTRFGVDCLYLAAMHTARGTAPPRIAFGYFPGAEE